MAYIDTDHYRQVIAATNAASFSKKKKTFINKADTKNYLIMRHIFERLRDTCGIFDGHREAVNYSCSGKPNVLPWGGPTSQYDIHVVEWQMELVRDCKIQANEILAPASIIMHTRWAITKQRFSKTFRLHQAAVIRRAAVNAYWLLNIDLIEIERSNFLSVTPSSAVTNLLDEIEKIVI